MIALTIQRRYRACVMTWIFCGLLLLHIRLRTCESGAYDAPFAYLPHLFLRGWPIGCGDVGDGKSGGVRVIVTVTVIEQTLGYICVSVLLLVRSDIAMPYLLTLLSSFVREAEARPTIENPGSCLIPTLGSPCLKAFGAVGAPTTPRPFGSGGGTGDFSAMCGGVACVTSPFGIRVNPRPNPPR